MGRDAGEGGVCALPLAQLWPSNHRPHVQLLPQNTNIAHPTAKFAFCNQLCFPVNSCPREYPDVVWGFPGNLPPPPSLHLLVLATPAGSLPVLNACSQEASHWLVLFKLHLTVYSQVWMFWEELYAPCRWHPLVVFCSFHHCNIMCHFLFYTLFKAKSRAELGNACQPGDEFAFFNCLDKQQGKWIYHSDRQWLDFVFSPGHLDYFSM